MTTKYANSCYYTFGMKKGDCVTIPDGRIGRIREINGKVAKVRVMRKTSKTHQFILLTISQLKSIACPAGWMSPEGYNRYLAITLEKMKKRLRK